MQKARVRPYMVVATHSYSIRNFKNLLYPLPCLEHKSTMNIGKLVENIQGLACIRRLWWNRRAGGEDLSVSQDTHFIAIEETVVKMRYFWFCLIHPLIIQTLPFLSEHSLLDNFWFWGGPIAKGTDDPI